jgi:hypothetical protein
MGNACASSGEDELVADGPLVTHVPISEVKMLPHRQNGSYEVHVSLEDKPGRTYKRYLVKSELPGSPLSIGDFETFLQEILTDTRKWVYTESMYVEMCDYVPSDTGTFEYHDGNYVYRPVSTTVAYQQYVMV